MQEMEHRLHTGKDLGKSRACVKAAVKKQHCIPLHKPQMHFVSGIEGSNFISYGQRVTGN